jgi:hypothetical protein
VESSGASAPAHYSITASTCHSIAHRAPSRARSHAFPFTYVGSTRGGVVMSDPLVTAAAKLRCLFNFHILFYYDMDEVPSSTFNRRARRLTPTSILVANFIPLQLQSSLPTSSLVAANFNPPHHSNSKRRRCAISSILLDGRRGVLDAATAR